MVTSMRHALLMLVALLSVVGPPTRPPGRNPSKDGSPGSSGPATASCPYPGCRGKGRREGDRKYRCLSCGKGFSYCAACRSSYQFGEEGKHRH
jgi:hypothetical protein